MLFARDPAVRAIPIRLVEQGTDWASWVTATASVLALVLIFWTARSALTSLADARRTRDAQLLTDLSRRWDEPLIIESVMLQVEHGPDAISALYARLAKTDGDKQDPADRTLYHKLAAWPNLLETIAVLHKRDAISADVIFQAWGGEIIRAWNDWKAPVQLMRTTEGDQQIYCHFEQLAAAMKSLDA